MPDEVRVGRFWPPRPSLIPDNGHLEGHYPAYTMVTYLRKRFSQSISLCFPDNPEGLLILGTLITIP